MSSAPYSLVLAPPPPSPSLLSTIPDPYPRHPIDTRLKPLLAHATLARGLFHALPSPQLVDMCAYAGFDFVVIDNEHGPCSFETTEHLVRAARGSGILPLARCLPQDIARTLDLGVSGLIIPMVNDADTAQSLAQRIHYPSEGARGSAFCTRAGGYGAFGGDGHSALSNAHVGFIPMIETVEGVRNARAIASVDGVDAVFIGPNDLAHSLGHGCDSKHADVQETIRTIMAEVVQGAGKKVGILAVSVEDEQRYRAWGASFFASVSTNIIMAALRSAAQAPRPE